MCFLDRSVDVNGMNLHYVEWGDAGAPPLVLLHGITGHARTWDRLASELASRWRIIALDQRGHGDSDGAPDGDYGVGPMAGDLAAFADRIGLGRFALLGPSMGGRVALAYAGDFAARLERLVIVDIGPDIHLPRARARSRDDGAGAGAHRVARRRPSSSSGAPTRSTTTPSCGTASPIAQAGGRRRAHLEVRQGASGHDAVAGRPETVDLWEPLPRIRCPTLIVRGAESDILSPEIAKRMLEALPDGRLVEVAGAGHTVPGDQPDAFARAVRAFIEE